MGDVALPLVLAAPAGDGEPAVCGLAHGDPALVQIAEATVDIGDRVVVDAVVPAGKGLVQVLDRAGAHGIAGRVSPRSAFDETGVADGDGLAVARVAGDE